MIMACNDTWAYIYGFSMGKTQLIKLSPNKTVEGFAGAAYVTLVFSFFFSWMASQFKYMICPRVSVDTFSGECETPYIFIMRDYHIPQWLNQNLSHYVGIYNSHLRIMPFQLHSLV
ncbi:MAG: hypothetical protein CUN55_20010, partial [Phototrophicales bacterium]